MNNKGQLIITELMLYILLITVILGFLIYLDNTVNNKNIETLSNYEANKMLENSMDMLVNSEGTPTNWQELPTSDVKSVGLKKNSTTNLVSYDKLVKLEDNNNLLDNLLDDSISYSLVLKSEDNISSTTIAGNTQSNANTYSKSVPVVVDYDYETLFIDEENNNCSMNHDKNEYSCCVIFVNNSLLSEGEYYIVATSDSASYILENSYNEQINGYLKDGVASINSEINLLQKSDNESIELHLNCKDGYLVYDKNNRVSHIKSVIDPEVYTLKLDIYT